MAKAGTVLVPEKSEQDLREYKFFVLDNLMKVLVVSDPETTKVCEQ